MRKEQSRGKDMEKNIEPEVESEQEDPLCSLFGTDSRFVRWILFGLENSTLISFLPDSSTTVDGQ